LPPRTFGEQGSHVSVDFNGDGRLDIVLAKRGAVKLGEPAHKKEAGQSARPLVCVLFLVKPTKN
jgi:hypothetical protein